MKILFLAIILFTSGIFTSSFHAKAQETVDITGQVKDDQTKANLPYCKVVALNAADSIVRGGITDEDGYFRLPLQPGQ